MLSFYDIENVHVIREVMNELDYIRCNLYFTFLPTVKITKIKFSEKVGCILYNTHWLKMMYCKYYIC